MVSLVTGHFLLQPCCFQVFQVCNVVSASSFPTQVVTNRDTQETLLCMACVFEVSNSEHGAQHHIYRLVKDWAVIYIYTSFHFFIKTQTVNLNTKWQCLWPNFHPHFSKSCFSEVIFNVFIYNCSCEILVQL